MSLCPLKRLSGTGAVSISSSLLSLLPGFSPTSGALTALGTFCLVPHHVDPTKRALLENRPGGARSCQPHGAQDTTASVRREQKQPSEEITYASVCTMDRRSPTGARAVLCRSVSRPSSLQNVEGFATKCNLVAGFATKCKHTSVRRCSWGPNLAYSRLSHLQLLLPSTSSSLLHSPLADETG